MKRVLVVGSGASGVHFALSVLKKGYRVTMVDVGHDQRTTILPTADFDMLKEQLIDPANYFLGGKFEGVVLPDRDKEYYGFPPHKQYIFDAPGDFEYSADGFAPMFSFAKGGLAEAWTGGCPTFNQHELADFPFDFDDLRPYYGEVARRIGITGVADDLTQFIPLHEHMLEPLRLDEHSKVLLNKYARRRKWLNKRLRCYVGRTRVATLSRDQDGRKGCTYLGRCLLGCPVESLYTPSQTLSECQRHANFSYISNTQAEFFKVNGRCAEGMVVTSAGGGTRRLIETDHIALAAGALCSTKILLRSIFEATGNLIRLGGLMDNRMLLLPFLNLHMLGRAFKTDSYQYHLLGMGLEEDLPAEYVHCQITTLKSALMHPIIQNLPVDLQTATALARATHAALGLVSVTLHDYRRPENYVTIVPDNSGSVPARLVIQYSPPPGESARIRRILRRLKRALWALGCIVPPGMLRIRPMGATIHYTGTVPMSRMPAPWTCDEYCRSREFENVFLVDGATMPFLPAKNSTFTLMANAVRVADRAF